MNLPRGKGRIAMIAILYAIVSGLLGVTILSAPMASSRGAGARHMIPPPPRSISTPSLLQRESQPRVPRPFSQSAANAPTVTSGVWTPLNSQPSEQTIDFFPGGEYLLTDGRVLVHDENDEDNTIATDWWTLTPDNTGSYINGTWTQVASPPNCPNGFPGASADTEYSPLYDASAVLADGRFVIIGGEYNFNYDYAMPGTGEVWTDQGAIYVPVA